MSADKLVKELADKARIAARTLVAADYKTRRDALLAIADAIIANTAAIEAANIVDMAREKSA